ncbi:hypothetical protein ACFE33_06325 [Falsihalocynthiibacter sp. SS001]|uniref:hypothetical protein n=1 Tax=Falsihalocynthiibacter sp. SS001 TaxID=3349698 RepID=UPI0036D22616
MLRILLEKSLFADPAAVGCMLKFRDSDSTLVGVAKDCRFMRPIGALCETMQEAASGLRTLTIYAHPFPILENVNDWNRFNAKSGGTFVEKCCHFFDLIRLADSSRAATDNGYVLVNFDNGVHAILELCMFAEGSRDQEEVRAVGPNDKLKALLPRLCFFGPLTKWMHLFHS